MFSETISQGYSSAAQRPPACEDDRASTDVTPTDVTPTLPEHRASAINVHTFILGRTVQSTTLSTSPWNINPRYN